MTHLIIVMTLWAEHVLPKQSLATEDLTVDVPSGFLEILNRFILEIGAPDILHRIAQTKVHMLGDLDTLDSGRMRSVMLGMVYVVVHISCSR